MDEGRPLSGTKQVLNQYYYNFSVGEVLKGYIWNGSASVQSC
jgi:hypothetical protein